MKKIQDELVIFSDLHAHNFKYGSRRIQAPEWGEGFYNSRLIDTMNVLDEIHNYVLENKIQTVLFGGDLFHRRSVLHTDAFNLVYSKFRQMGEYYTIHMIPGNHDYADKHGKIHSLSPFEDLGESRIEVWDKVDWAYTSGGVLLVFVPYTDDIEEARKRLEDAKCIADDADYSVLLAHLGMQGAIVGSNYVLVSDNDISVSDVPKESFDACFFGHFHEHQQLFQNGWFIGSTHEHNWGDSGGKRGFLHVHIYTDGTVDFDRIETQAPKFVEYDLGETPTHRSQDFVRINVPKGSHSVLRRLDKQVECANLEVVEEVDDSKIEFTLEPNQLNPESAMTEWAKAHPPENVGTDEVVKQGVEILRETIGVSQ